MTRPLHPRSPRPVSACGNTTRRVSKVDDDYKNGEAGVSGRGAEDGVNSGKSKPPVPGQELGWSAGGTAIRVDGVRDGGVEGRSFGGLSLPWWLRGGRNDAPAPHTAIASSSGRGASTGALATLPLPPLPSLFGKVVSNIFTVFLHPCFKML